MTTVNKNRETTYLYIKARKDVVGAVCVDELKFYGKGIKYLDWLTAQGHLKRHKEIVNGRIKYIYNAATLYVIPTQEKTVPVSTKDQEIIKSVTRVFKLLDRPQEPLTKEQRDKVRATTKSVAIGSSMNMFGGW